MKRFKIWFWATKWTYQEKDGGPARRPATPRAGPKKTTRFALSGQPGPAHLKRAKNGPDQNGSGWPVLTPLLVIEIQITIVCFHNWIIHVSQIRPLIIYMIQFIYILIIVIECHNIHLSINYFIVYHLFIFNSDHQII